MPKSANPLLAIGKRADRKGREQPGPHNHPLKTFTYWVALPTVLVYVAVCALVLFTLALMTSELNRIDADRGEKAITAALDSLVRQLGEITIDEATWTEAYLNTYVAFNPAWLDGSWGTTARQGQGYDLAVVTNADGEILFGESNRGALTGNISDHFAAPKALFGALGKAVEAAGDDTHVSGLSTGKFGIAALAAAVIHGNTGQAPIAASERRVLWMAKHIDEQMLQEFSQRFQIPLLRLATGASPGEANRPLIDASGAEMGMLVWLPLRPGDPAFLNAASIASVVLLCIGALTFAVLMAFRRSVERRAESEERDWHSARYDGVTGLHNRFGLEESLSRLVPRKGGETAVAVALIGFDGLRDVTSSYGQETTDKLLDALADRIDEATEGQAIFARTGPDEFALCRVGEEAERLIRAFAGKVLALMNEPVVVDDLRLKLGTSIGIAEAACARTTIAEPLRMADAALQRARETGGNHVIVYDVSLKEERQHRLAMQADIRRGLDADEFDLEYQPIVDFGTSTIIGVEALLRWNRRAGGRMSPGEFIPAAEASGLIEDLGLFALRRACRDIVRLTSLKLSVNVSTVQFRSPTLSRRIDAILAATSFPPERLQLEITESFLLAQPERAKVAIEELRSRGIAIALDDFGTGFSSIGYLQQFSFDRVKLDRSLIEDVDVDPVKAALVESTMVFAFAMGLSVTVEGVERREEAATLTRLGCREFQGYLFSKPLPLESLERLLRTQAPLRKAG
ncbi:MAG: putative bifunctional diguanylate cyclase/phosphodiesterase [Devosia sp.]